MKNLRILALCIMFFPAHLIARIGCLANSSDVPQKYDYKEYRPVSCMCPCERYKIKHNGTCSKCGHRHTYTFISQQETNPEKVINVGALKKYATTKNKKSDAKLVAANQELNTAI